jgi:hypothetical protein
MPASEALNETRLPRAVRAQAERLKERYSKGKSPDLADPTGPQAETPPEVPAGPPATPAVAPVPPAPPDLANEIERLRQAHASVVGRLNVVAEERRTEKLAWKQERDQLLEQIRDLRAKQPPAEIDLGKHFTPEQIEALGETQCMAMVATAQRVAQESIDTAVEAAVKPLREKQAATEQATESDADQRYFARLQALVPNWAEINVLPAWLEWLTVEEGDSGIERDALLKKFHDQRNAEKVGKFFQRYLAETAPAPTPVPPTAARGSGAQPAGDPPPRSDGGNNRLLPPTPKEVSDFYKRAATKKPGQHGFVTDKERAEFEARQRLLSRQ